MAVISRFQTSSQGDLLAALHPCENFQHGGRRPIEFGEAAQLIDRIIIGPDAEPLDLSTHGERRALALEGRGGVLKLLLGLQPEAEMVKARAVAVEPVLVDALSAIMVAKLDHQIADEPIGATELVIARLAAIDLVDLA